MLAPFRRAPDARIEAQEYAAVEWFLAADAHRFHVYAVARLPAEGREPEGAKDGLWVRVDWNDSSTLTFAPLSAHAYAHDARWPLGRARFAKAELEEAMAPWLRHYSLLSFNCRTVAFILLERAGFDADALFALYERESLLCGLVTDTCFSATEIMRFRAWLHARRDAHEEARVCGMQ